MIAHFHVGACVAEILAKNDRNLLLVESKWTFANTSQPIGSFGGGYRALEDDQWEFATKILRLCAPLWSRSAPDRGQLDNYLSQLTKWIGLIYSDLRGLGIKYAIFHTSSPHHASTVCLQIACQLAGIPTIYLYTEWVGGRSLPMTFEMFESSLAPAEIEVSSHDARAEVDQFSLRAMQGKPPGLAKSRYPIVNQSRILSTVRVCGWHWAFYCRHAFQTLETSREKMLNDSHLFEAEVNLDFMGRPSWTLGDEIRAMRDQSAALTFLRKHSLNHRAESQKDRTLVFFAHFQPEASTFPEQGLVLSSMLRVMQMICRSVWSGRVVFREHPASLCFSDDPGPTRVGVARSVDFYRQLLELGVELEWPGSPGVTGPDDVVATVAGSVALERSLRGEPTLVLGQPWFGDIPGIVKFDGLGKWLGTYDDLLRATTTKANATDYLTDFLSRKTITNVQGIGQVPPSQDPASIENYIQEMDRLCDTLINRL